MTINSQLKSAKFILAACGLLGLTAVMSPALAAQLGPFEIPFSFTAFDGCIAPIGSGVNENILFTGTLVVEATETANSSGGYHIDEYLVIQNGKGTGQATGTLYPITGIVAIPQNNRGPRFSFDTGAISGQSDFSFEIEASFVDTGAPRVPAGVFGFLRETVVADGSLTNLSLEPLGVACG